MTNWKTFEAEAPDMAAKVEARLRAHTHHVMATIRTDGSPRVSGTEVDLSDGEVCIGSMWQSRKAVDLLRDGRLAIHSNPGDESMEGGDAKLSATAVELPDDHPAKARIRDDSTPPEPFHLFRLDLHEVVLTEVDHDAGLLRIYLWRPGGPPTTTERR